MRRTSPLHGGVFARRVWAGSASLAASVHLVYGNTSERPIESLAAWRRYYRSCLVPFVVQACSSWKSTHHTKKTSKRLRCLCHFLLPLSDGLLFPLLLQQPFPFSFTEVVLRKILLGRLSISEICLRCILHPPAVDSPSDMNSVPHASTGKKTCLRSPQNVQPYSSIRTHEHIHIYTERERDSMWKRTPSFLLHPFIGSVRLPGPVRKCGRQKRSDGAERNFICRREGKEGACKERDEGRKESLSLVSPW